MTAIVVATLLTALLAGAWAAMLLGVTAALAVTAVERRARHRTDRRRRFSPAERRHVLARDGWRCLWCGTGSELEVDHVVPWSRGGRTSVHNAQTLCRSCNASKGAR